MKKRNIIIVIILTIIALYIVLKDNYQEIIPLLFQANIGWLFLGYLLMLSYTFLKAIVTNEIIESFRKYGIINTFKLQLMTFFFNSVTPFSTGGQPFQIYVLNKNGLTLPEASNIVVQESIIHQMAMSIVLLLTILLNEIFNIYQFNFMMGIFLLLSFFINAIIVIFLFVLSYNEKIDNAFIKTIINILYKLKIIKNKEEKQKKWGENVQKFNIASKNLLQDKKRFIKLVMINCVSIICFCIVPLLVLFSLKDYSSFNGIEAIVLVSFVAMISCYVPLPGGSLGQEYLFNLFFGIYVNEPMLSSLMILWRFITYYFPMIVGAIIFNISRKK